MVNEGRPRKRATSKGKAELRRTESNRPQPHDKGAEDAANTIRRQTRRKLSDHAGILSKEAVRELRHAIDEGRKERARLDRERLARLLEASDRPGDLAVFEAARRKAKSAGLTRKKARELLEQVKKEAWNRTYGDKKQGE